MALTTDEQKFYDFAKAALPDWIPDGDEFLHGAAKMFGGVKALIDYLFGSTLVSGQALISGAEGATATTPDWLNQHARDRGTSRVDGEDDPTLRERLRTVQDLLTRAALQSAIDAILVAAGINDPCGIVELPRHGAHSGVLGVSDYAQLMEGAGGTFAVAGTAVSFTPDVLPWPRPPYFDPSLFPLRTTKLYISGAASAAHDGVHDISGLSGNAAQWTDGAPGAAGADATVSWQVRIHNAEGWMEGFGRAYSGTGGTGGGYRSARILPLMLVVILPFGTTDAVELSVREALRTKKAAGIAVKIERRSIAP